MMSSSASSQLLRSAAAAPLLGRYASLQLSSAATGAVARSRRRSGRLVVVPSASAEVAEPATGYTTESLILYFKAEGTMEERAIPKITQALEGVDGVSELEVLIEEGIGSVVVCFSPSNTCQLLQRGSVYSAVHCTFSTSNLRVIGLLMEHFFLMKTRLSGNRLLWPDSCLVVLDLNEF